ncbi:MAG: glycerate kinase type-2 family protein [Geminicoccaceae bacterium]
MNDDQQRRLLRSMLDAAIDAALPSRLIKAHLPPKPEGRTIVLGAGKAAAAMAREVEDHMIGPVEGLVVTRYGHGAACRSIEVIEAAHPVPDDAGKAAAGRILELAKSAGADDLVLCLVSGGASSLLALPAAGLSLDDKQALNRALLESGADITQMNTVRKHLSAIKGGRLAAAAHPAKVVSLLISDVPGDDPAVIGSGPTVADPTSFSDALEIVERYGITKPKAIIDHLKAAKDETPKADDPRLAAAENRVIATPQASLEAALAVALDHGVRPVVLGDAIEGEAREVARVLAGVAQQVRRHAQPAMAPCVILPGGETTVTMKGKGRGGRNAEFLLALAIHLGGADNVYALAADTDGIDGSETNAGAMVTPDTLERAASLGLDPKGHLADNDGFGFFERLEDLVTTGPTLTNVNDFRAILIV